MLPANLKDIVDKPDYQRTKTEKQMLAAYFRLLDQLPQATAGIGDPLLAGFAGLVTTAEHAQLASYRLAIEQKLTLLKKKEPDITKTLVVQERAAPRAVGKPTAQSSKR